MEKQASPRFTLGKVVTFPYYYNYVLGFVVIVPPICLYGIYGMPHFGLWGLVVTFLIFGSIITAIIKALSKSVTIYFDEEYMYLNYDDKKTEQYLKKDIAGLYSYNYERIKKSFISIQFRFTNGDKLELTDIDMSEKVNQEKAQLLRGFLQTAKRELNFTLINKSRARSLQKLGAEWYAKASQV